MSGSYNGETLEEDDYREQILNDIEEILTNEDGVGEDTSLSMSLEEIAEAMGMEEFEVREVLYSSRTLDSRFHYEFGMYSRC